MIQMNLFSSKVVFKMLKRWLTLFLDNFLFFYDNYCLLSGLEWAVLLNLRPM